MRLYLFFLLIFFTNYSIAKEIKIIIPYSAGGPTDKVTRTVLKYLNDGPYKFLPEYKLGAGGSIAANYVADIKDETVLMVTSNALISSPILNQTANYDVIKDFILVDFLGTEPLLLVIKQDTNIISYSDFLLSGKTQSMPYGSAGLGTSGHISSVIITGNADNFIHVPYKGSAGMIVDLLNGQLKWIIDSEINLGNFLKDGKIKPLVVYAPKRLSNYSKIPTLKELGVEDENFYRWHVVVANRNANVEVIDFVRKRLDSSNLKSELEKLGLITDKPKLSNFLNDESAKIIRISKKFNLK